MQHLNTRSAEDIRRQYATEPLFKSAHAALAFAFNYAVFQYAISGMGALIKNKPGDEAYIGTGRGLIGLDGAAQAGFIMREVCTLNWGEKMCLIARFAPQKDGKQLTENFKAALDIMIKESRQVPFESEALRLVLVWRYFGLKGRVKDFAEDAGVSKSMAYYYFADIHEILAKLEMRSMMLITGKLQALGIVECTSDNNFFA